MTSSSNTNTNPSQQIKQEQQQYASTQIVQEQINKNDLLLEYYSVDSCQELIGIMISQQKSQTYNNLRNSTNLHLQSQNFNTIKSSIQYKRQLLLNLFMQAHQQVKGKINKQSNKQTNKQINKQSNKQSVNRQKNENKLFGNFLTIKNNHNHHHHGNLRIHSPKALRKKSSDILNVSNHSYQQLITYFTTNNDSLLCKRILKQKYSRCQVIHSHRVRKNFWLRLIGIDKKHDQYPLMYQTLTQYKQYPDFFTRIIHADVIRTIHDSDQKQKKQTMQKMQRILINFSRRNPYIGYCQGMNFILNFIITMQFEQQQCFWILQNVLQQIIPFGYYTNMSGVAIDIKILQIILKQLYPNILNKLNILQIDLSIFVLQWLVCLFTSTLPFYLLVIVWDLLLIQGSSVLLKVAIIMLEYLGAIIEQATDFANFFVLYETTKKKIYIQQQVFLKKYNKIYIDHKILLIVREIYQIEIKTTKQQIRKNQNNKQNTNTNPNTNINNQKWKQIDCNHQWPICFQQLKKQKLDDYDVDIWIIKQQKGPKIITDYLTQKCNRKYKKIIQQQYCSDDIYKKLVIGRIPHICLVGQNNKNKNINVNKNSNYYDGIQLNQLQTVKNGDEIVVRPRRDSGEDKQQQGQGIGKIKAESQSSTDFFRRATFNSIAFKHLRSLHSKNSMNSYGNNTKINNTGNNK